MRAHTDGPTMLQWWLLFSIAADTVVTVGAPPELTCVLRSSAQRTLNEAPGSITRLPIGLPHGLDISRSEAAPR